MSIEGDSIVTDEEASEEIPTIHKPKLIVFDLDYTLWPYFVSTAALPFKTGTDGVVYDSKGRRAIYYEDVPNIMTSLTSDGYSLAIASRSMDPRKASNLLEELKLIDNFSFVEIYFTKDESKIKHFKMIKKCSDIEYEDMLFFDDDLKIVEDIKILGVTCVHVEAGLTKKTVDEGLELFHNNRCASRQIYNDSLLSEADRSEPE